MGRLFSGGDLRTLRHDERGRRQVLHGMRRCSARASRQVPLPRWPGLRPTRSRPGCPDWSGASCCAVKRTRARLSWASTCSCRRSFARWPTTRWPGRIARRFTLPLLAILRVSRPARWLARWPATTWPRISWPGRGKRRTRSPRRPASPCAARPNVRQRSVHTSRRSPSSSRRSKSPQTRAIGPTCSSAPSTRRSRASTRNATSASPKRRWPRAASSASVRRSSTQLPAWPGPSSRRWPIRAAHWSWWWRRGRSSATWPRRPKACA
ncbi:hypothetical protein BH24CHL5_BH24CHL5_10240 [soil metagenome]